MPFKIPNFEKYFYPTDNLLLQLLHWRLYEALTIYGTSYKMYPTKKGGGFVEIYQVEYFSFCMDFKNIRSIGIYDIRNKKWLTSFLNDIEVEDKEVTAYVVKHALLGTLDSEKYFTIDVDSIRYEYLYSPKSKLKGY